MYRSLQRDRDEKDITQIIRRLHSVVDEAIDTAPPPRAGEQKPFDISRIDFDRLRKEFERSRTRRTTVQNLKQAVEEPF